MKSAVVTGAGGFIGSALSRALLDKGYKVYGVDIQHASLEQLSENCNFVPICMDLNEQKLSDAICEEVDVFFYLCWGGALGGNDLYDEELQIENIRTAVRVCKDSLTYCRHFIFVSSSYEFMKNISGNADINVYGIAKGAASKLCASVAERGNMKFNKAILTNTYGVGDRSKKAVNTLINMMLSGQTLKLVEGNNPNDWVYIDDTVNGLISIFEKGVPYREYYIGHKDITTFREKIIAMRDLLCPGTELAFGTFNDNGYVDYSNFDLDALYEDTGFECKTDFAQSIYLTAEWVKKFF